MRLCHGLAASSVPVSVKEVFNKETFFFTLLYLGAHTQQYFYISTHLLFACQISKGGVAGPDAPKIQALPKLG